MKHLTKVADLSDADIERIFKLAVGFEAVLERKMKKVPALAGRTVAFLFVEPSTRTRVSFELAARRLSADTVTLSAGASSLKKGETLEDTAYTLAAMRVDAVVIRHPHEGAADALARLGLFSVINGGDGKHEHPTQALLDAYCALKHFGSLEGTRVAIVGDVLHSRVARSGAQLWKRLGATVAFVAPPTMLPERPAGPDPIFHSLDDLLAEWGGECGILYFLRIQRERLEEPCLPSLAEYRAFFALTKERLARLPESTRIMHPGPVNVGVELDREAVRDARSLIDEQVRCGLAVRMAVLADTIAGEGGDVEVPA